MARTAAPLRTPARRLPRPLVPLALAGLAFAGLPAGLPAGAATGPANEYGSQPAAYGLSDGFELVGHADLGNRGMNSPIAVAGDCVYVGDRADKGGIAVVDVADPANPVLAGTIPPRAGSTQREIRADRGLGLLVVMSYSLSTAGAGNDLQTYDIRDCRHPVKLGTYDFGRRSPHEFFLWKDPVHAGRSLAYVTNTLFSPDLEVVDLTDPAAPALAAAYDIVVDIAKNPADVPNSGSGYLHSISVSDDGTRAYMGTWDYGLYVADTSTLANALPGGKGVVRPLGLPVSYAGNVHGGVKVPGRPYAVLVEEAYANAGKGCPFGWLRMASLADETQPTLLGDFKTPENAADCVSAKAKNGTFSSHNQTVFPDVALVPWYAGGLRAVDISDPTKLRETGVFVPEPEQSAPRTRDTRLFFAGTSTGSRWNGAMWSYPVVKDGLIYVVDIDLGLYVLRYTGAHADQVAAAGFVEGNSAPSRYTRAAAPGVPGQGARLDAARARVATTGVTVTRSPLPAAVSDHTHPYGFFCVGLASS